MKLLQRLASMAVAVTLSLPLLAHSGSDWAHYKKLLIDTTATGAGVDAAVTQLPVLVRLHTGNFPFSEAKPDGADLRFFAGDNKTELKYHIERYDATDELAVVWVQLPRLSPNAKTDAIMVHWGNPAAAASGDSKATYDASQVLVLNFSDAEGVKDATGNANNASESTAKPVAFGPIGQAAGFDGNARIVLPASANLKLAGSEGWTFTAWVKSTSLDKGTLFFMGTGAQAFSIELAAGNAVVRSEGKSAKSTSPLKAGVWQHLAVAYGAGKVQFFLNGAPVGEAALNVGDASGDAMIGAGLVGELDAVTLARGARTPAYLKALASSQSADTPMLGFVETAEAEGINYFAILLGAVTIDGWVVIGILGVMAVISLWVMVTKTVNLARAEKANAAFLQLFKEKSEMLLSPDHAEVKALAGRSELKHSSIYKLYIVGIAEIAHRFASQNRTNKPNRLSGAALESIRAALDATIVRASQRFNSGIVLLTISISGGPFLGLLGTVVGVMITFAAIAAAGDVNVNAIAPGIAAALVATVAGLAVAIPALFAYNWFAIKIKNISADTQVFADEFLTQSAELHSD
jgi:biopolymer transport protein ExbB